MFKKKRLIKTIFYLVLFLIISSGVVWPFFQPGFFPFHDNAQVARVQQMAEALQDGQLPVHWVRDLGYGYGYPIFKFYAPLPYYLGGSLVLLGLTPLVATKIIMAAPLILSGLSMFFWAQANWGSLGGLLAALFYTYAPYKAVNCYVRGAVGELWAMVFLPLVFWGFQSFLKKRKHHFLVFSFGLAGLILSHNILAMLMALILIILFLIILLMRFFSLRKRLGSFLASIAVGLGLSAFFWLPALLEASSTKVQALSQGANHFSQHFVFLDQLWNSAWGFAGSAPGRLDGMSFKIGKLHLLMALIGLIWLLKQKDLKRLKKEILILGLFPVALSVFMMLKVSRPVWQAIAPLVFTQYPWRFLAFSIMGVSFLTGAIFLPKKQKFFKQFNWLVLLIIVLALLFLNLKLFQPQLYSHGVKSEDYTSKENIVWETSKISDEYLPKDFVVPEKAEERKGSLVVADDPAVEIEILSHKSNFIEARINSPKEVDLTIHLAYQPDWRVFLNDQEHQFNIKDGFISVNIPKGEHLLTVKLVNTPLLKLANAAFLASALIVFGVKYWQRQRKSGSKGKKENRKGA